MFSIFRKKAPSHHKFDFLEVDMHSHLIPGIDDGSPNSDTSAALLEEMWNMGFKKIITTPHVYKELYPNTASIITNGLDQLKKEHQYTTAQLGAAAEYFADEHLMELVGKKEILCLHERKFLMEFSFYNQPLFADDFLFQALTSGYTPVIAHVERYQFLENKTEKIAHWQEMGCLIQVNLGSLEGYYGKHIRQFAHEILKQGLIDFLGTDLHHERHLASIKRLLAADDLMKTLYKYEFKNQGIG